MASKNPTIIKVTRRVGTAETTFFAKGDSFQGVYTPSLGAYRVTRVLRCEGDARGAEGHVGMYVNEGYTDVGAPPAHTLPAYRGR